MARLTNSIKEQIISKAIQKSHIPEKEKLFRVKEVLLAEEVRVFKIGGADVVNKVEKAATAIFDLTSDLPTSVLSNPFVTHTSLYISGYSKYLQLGEYKICASGSVCLERNSDLYLRIGKFFDGRDTLATERKNLEAEIDGILSQCTTDTKLLKIWPESKELLEGLIQAPVLNPPALPIDDLNKKLGLPTISY